MAFCGRIISAGSGDLREYLGQHLVSRGTISGEHFAEAFEEQKETNVLLGKVLVLRGPSSKKNWKKPSGRRSWR